MPETKPLILFIDAYDSFSNNIISLLESTLEVTVRSVKIDDSLLASDISLRNELKYYAAVVCGPGPGHPNKWEDVRIIRRIWELEEEDLIPVLGICLGFQSLCAAFGGKVDRLKGPQHGIIRKITHVGGSAKGRGSIFEGVEEIQTTLYQSLFADTQHNSMPQDVFQREKWNPTSQCPDLLPLAWAEWDGNEDNNSGMRDKIILVAVRHRTKPFWALQYHPESICTNKESNKVIENWFRQAREWNNEIRREKIKPVLKEGLMEELIGQPVIQKSLLEQNESQRFLWSSKPVPPPSRQKPQLQEILSAHLDEVYRFHTVSLPHYVSTPDIVEILQDSKRDQIILDSSNCHESSAQVRGRYSIIALNVDECLRFDYYKFGRNGDGKHLFGILPSENGPMRVHVDLHMTGGIWPFLAQFLEKRRISNGNPNSPFWGGFMGLTSYELGLETIQVQSDPTKTVDLSLAWVTRSVVLDHEKRLIYLQDISKKNCDPSPPSWMLSAIEKLSKFHPSKELGATNLLLSCRMSEDVTSSHSSLSNLRTSTYSPVSSRSSFESNPSLTSQQISPDSIKTPSAAAYELKVRRCQEYIRNGDSYELCLTDQTTVRRPRLDMPSSERAATYAKHLSDIQQRQSILGDAWSLYRSLRTRQPAPFASFVRLGSATLISSSPERFLTWTTEGHCSLRPMKGTVRKSIAVPTLADAIPLLDIPKEKAENLMIVDLVRHDLHGICGSGNVSVPRLMVVEEYKSVFQMISIVEGKIPERLDGDGKPTRNRHTGLDVLAASLPPGSMTGAPKKRSCEILQEIEGKPRGLYSGVVGYMDVGGRGDWSVTIRSMFRFDDEDVLKEHGEKSEVIETWHIGAGGAVTALSTPEGEREEMLTKLTGTLGVFT